MLRSSVGPEESRGNVVIWIPRAHTPTEAAGSTSTSTSAAELKIGPAPPTPSLTPPTPTPALPAASTDTSRPRLPIFSLPCVLPRAVYSEPSRNIQLSGCEERHSLFILEKECFPHLNFNNSISFLGITLIGRGSLRSRISGLHLPNELAHKSYLGPTGSPMFFSIYQLLL